MEMKNNPTQKPPIGGYKFMQSPRCGAKTRKQTPCLSPAVQGKKRCRMHGGAKGTGAPKGNRNALKHGHTTHEAKAKKREVRLAIKEWRKLEGLFLKEEENDF